jgi:hypothetical protein
MAITTLFDTYKAVTLLQKRGLAKDAAEGITELLKDVTETNMVTKADLELALEKQTSTIIRWVTGILVAHAALVVALVELLGRR